MDRWLAALERDQSTVPIARKVLDDKPADIQDECWNGTGTKLIDGLCGPAVVPVYGTPRTVAGDAITTDDNKCRLRPLRRIDYSAQFTAGQWAELQRTFPTGVCDYTMPGIDQQPTIPWLTYESAARRVIYGGWPLGSAPRSTPFG
jgi:hypothetical protein